jgi:hypothetical protein
VPIASKAASQRIGYLKTRTMDRYNDKKLRDPNAKKAASQRIGYLGKRRQKTMKDRKAKVKTMIADHNRI